MKRVLSLVLAVVMLLGCTVALASCGMKGKIAGTYEMESIEGTITYGGYTTDLDESLYEYYRIILEKDGTAIVESRAAGSTAAMEEEGTWEYEDDKIKLKTNPQGITVVEEMEWDDGTITYKANQNAQGMQISFTLVLKKVK